MWVIMDIIIYIRNLVSSHNNSVRQRAIIVPILQIRKVGLRKVKWLAFLSSRSWIGTWSLMPVYALDLSCGITSVEGLMKSVRRNGRIPGNRVHQHNMALKFETGWKGGERRASMEGRPPREKVGY